MGTTITRGFCKISRAECALFLMVAFAATATDAVRADARSKDLQARAVVNESGIGGCATDQQCDDGDVCTQDRCVDGACAGEAIPGCIACAVETQCPPIDIVFLMDTSGSMMDEAEVLCSAMSEVVSALGAEGAEIRATFLGITETPGGAFSCLTGNVVSLLGGTVPSDGASCPFPGRFSSHESWGPASAIVAERFPWNDGAVRMIVPLSDEGPCEGSFPDGCNDPGDDRDSILNAANVAIEHDVMVSPITGTSSDACVNALAGDLAAMTGGTAMNTQAPRSDLAEAIRSIITSVCEPSDACDDGNLCTVNDTCMPTGGCVGTPIDLISCASDSDCYDSLCNFETGTCVCADRPSLCLNVATPLPPGGKCYAAAGDGEGDILVVDVVLGYSVHTVIGGQFLIGYDPEVLEYLSSEPGSARDPDSPFSQVLSKIVDEERGRIFFAVGATLDKFGSKGPVTMASLSFRPIGACSSSELCFFDENPMTTRLSDETGTSVPFDPCCSGTLTIAGDSPKLICPSSRQLNVQAGTLSAVATWDPVEVVPGCGGPVAWSCIGTNGDGAPVGHLAATGGTFPIGTTRFDCTAIEESCGLYDECSWTVTVAETSLVEVDVELSSPMVGGPLDRCIEFEFVSSCAEAPFVYRSTLRFGLPFNFPGNARRVQIQVPAGEYACARARDPLHTLRSATNMTIVGSKFVARFVGDPLLGGNWLVGGNLDGNGVIDAVDLAVVMGSMSAVVAPNTSCGMANLHADINGDGIVDLLDLAFVERNLFDQDTAACCGGGRSSAPMAEVSIKSLRAMGLGHLGGADVNRDGKVNLDDLSSIKQGRSPFQPKATRAIPGRKEAVVP